MSFRWYPFKKYCLSHYIIDANKANHLTLTLCVSVIAYRLNTKNAQQLK